MTVMMLPTSTTMRLTSAFAAPFVTSEYSLVDLGGGAPIVGQIKELVNADVRVAKIDNLLPNSSLTAMAVGGAN